MLAGKVNTIFQACPARDKYGDCSQQQQGCQQPGEQSLR